MLSSQTKDAVVGAAVQRLKDDQVLTVQAILDMDRSKLADDYLKSVGFRNNKARYLQETAAILLRNYDGDIPPTAALMMELPGVGPKMAYITENVAWNKQSGIGVDTHMHRLLPLLDWARRNSKSPEQTRIHLQAWLPLEYWKDVNLLWVGFGQEIQQQKQKILTKALHSSQPGAALRLLKRCGMDVRKEAKRYGLDDSVASALFPAKEE
jgi:endonuclease-3